MWVFIPSQGHSSGGSVVNVGINSFFLNMSEELLAQKMQIAVFGIACERKSSRIVVLLEREEATILESVILKSVKNSPVSI